jgi:hypothetical protein
MLPCFLQVFRNKCCMALSPRTLTTTRPPSSCRHSKVLRNLPPPERKGMNHHQCNTVIVAVTVSCTGD